MPHLLRPHLRLGRDERGFTIVEVLVAAFILLVGMAASIAMIDQASSTTTTNKAREQGLALDREVIETVRSISFNDLTTSNAVSRLQAMSAFADNGGGDGWTVDRRGVTYQLSVGVCDVDDPLDDTGAHAANRLCVNGNGTTSAARCQQLIGMSGSVQGTSAAASAGAEAGDCGLDLNLDGAVDNLVQATPSGCPTGTSTAAGTCDSQPADYKRVVVLVAWDRGSGRRYALQAATIPFPGLSTAPSITSLAPRGFPADANGGFNVTSDAVSTLTFDAVTNRAAAGVRWAVSGTDKGAASGSGTAWSFDWALGAISSTAASPATGEVVDGSYTVSAQASDSAGLHGQDYAVTINLNRRAPYAPTRFLAGRQNGQVVTEWVAPPDQDVIGYRLYRRPTGGTATLVGSCSLVTATQCADTSPPNASTIDYWVVAVDKSPAGIARDGAASAPGTVVAGNQPPTTPTNLTVTIGARDKKTLTWTGSTDPDGRIAYYRIYRDGVLVAKTANGNQTTYSETMVGTHTYRLSAVDNQLAESSQSNSYSA